MFDESTRFKQVCQLLLSLIVAYDANCFLDIPWSWPILDSLFNFFHSIKFIFLSLYYRLFIWIIWKQGKMIILFHSVLWSVHFEGVPIFYWNSLKGPRRWKVRWGELLRYISGIRFGWIPGCTINRRDARKTSLK